MSIDFRQQRSPKTAKLNIIIVSARRAVEHARSPVREYNIAQYGETNVKHVVFGEALGGFPADIIIIADNPHRAIENVNAVRWINEFLRLRLKPGGLWIEAY